MKNFERAVEEGTMLLGELGGSGGNQQQNIKTVPDSSLIIFNYI